MREQSPSDRAHTPLISAEEQAADWVLQLHSQPDEPDLRAACHAWCAQDPRHQAAYAKATRAWDLGQSLLPAVETETGTTQDTICRPSRLQLRPRLRHIAGLAVAACLALVLALNPAWILPYDPSTHQTGTAEWQQVTFSDGSRVDLAPGTTLRAVLDGPARRVTLEEGDAFFAVAPDTSRPFTVAAGTMTVTVTGTRFAVRNRDGQWSVQVEEGRVDVTAPGTDRQTLTAGQALGQPKTGPAVRSTVAPDAVALWRDGMLAVENMSVSDVAAALAPCVPGWVVVADTALAQQRVTGVYSLRDPRAALQALVTPFGGTVTSIGPVVTVLSGP